MSQTVGSPGQPATTEESTRSESQQWSADREKSTASRESTYGGDETPSTDAPTHGKWLRWLHASILIRPKANPYEYSKAAKWTFLFAVAGAGAAEAISSMIIYPGLPDIPSDLHTTSEQANLAVTLTRITRAVFPLWWSDIADIKGRRPIFIATITLFVVFSVVSAVAINIPMLIVMQMLATAFASSGTPIGAAVISDTWEVHERGTALGVFYLGPLAGSAIGPVVGGVLVQKWGWRATQWFMALWGGFFAVAMLLFLPETLSASAGAKEQGESPPRTIGTRLRTIGGYLVRPLTTISNLRLPAIALTIYLAGTSFGVFGSLGISIQEAFSAPPYSFSATLVGVAYIPLAIGLIISSLLGGGWADRIMKRHARKAGRGEDYRATDRLGENAWLGLLLFTGSTLAYGWTIDRRIFWAAPLSMTFVLGLGAMLIFGVSTTMLTEFKPEKRASLVALNSLGRNLCNSIGGTITLPLANLIGFGWLFTALGVLIASNFAVVQGIRRYGKR